MGSIDIKKWEIMIPIKYFAIGIGTTFAAYYKLKAIVNALPQQNTSALISHVELSREIIIKIKGKICAIGLCASFTLYTINNGYHTISGPFKQYSPSGIQPFESYAGGTDKLDGDGINFFVFNPIGSISNYAKPGGTSTGTPFLFSITIGTTKVKNLKFNNPTFSYISRVSALDIENPVAADYTQPLIQPLNGLNRSRASKYVCQEVTSVSGASLFNLASGRFTKRNAQWMFKTMENEPTLTENCLGYTACYNSNSFAISGEEVVCSSKPFNLTNFPVAATITWSVNPPNMASFFPPTTPSTTLSLNNNGGAYLFASISNTCFTAPIVVSKEIYLGAPPTNPTILGWQTSGLNEPTVWRFEAVPLLGATYQWYLDGGRYMNTASNNMVDVPIPCNIRSNIQGKIMNACGMSNLSNIIQTSIGYCKPTRGGISTFPIDQPIYAPKRLNVTVATSSSELFGHLFYNKESLANEMIQGVNVYNKSGNIIMQTGVLNTKSTHLDFTNQPDGTYFIEVLGKEKFRELHTFYYSSINQEEYILDNIANGSIVINGDRAADRLYVMQQKLYNDLQCNEEAMNASAILQEFAKDKAIGSFGYNWIIQNALGKDDITTATALLEKWEPINAIDNNFKNYYLYYIKIINSSTLEEPELATLHSIAQGCPLTDGEIVYAARDLYNYLDSTNTDDYSNACSSIGLRMQPSITTEWTGFSKINNLYPNPSKGNITIDNLEYGTKTINVCNIYGKSIVKQQTNNKTININLNLNAGIYFVNITNTKTGKTETQKLIINN